MTKCVGLRRCRSESDAAERELFKRVMRLARIGNVGKGAVVGFAAEPHKFA